MAKINNNGKTIKENPTKKNSAKSASNAINHILNLMGSSMSPEARQNAQTIATIISMI